jgi:hypothetical protein
VGRPSCHHAVDRSLATLAGNGLRGWDRLALGMSFCPRGRLPPWMAAHSRRGWGRPAEDTGYAGGRLRRPCRPRPLGGPLGSLAGSWGGVEAGRGGEQRLGDARERQQGQDDGRRNGLHFGHENAVVRTPMAKTKTQTTSRKCEESKTSCKGVRRIESGTAAAEVTDSDVTRLTSTVESRRARRRVWKGGPVQYWRARM